MSPRGFDSVAQTTLAEGEIVYSVASRQVGWGLAWFEGWLHLATSLHSPNEPGEFSQWPGHDDSTINIVIGIIRISIIILYYH